MSDHIRSRRALLYMPGDDLHKIQKAANLGVDCICMDIEDGVAFNHKQAARETIVQALATLEFGKSERLVRINSIQTPFFEEDLVRILPARPDGVVIPKVESSEPIQQVSTKISRIEKENGWPKGAMIIIAIVETARGILNLREICQSDQRLSALILGAEDLAADMGAVRTQAGWEIFLARSILVLHCAAYGLGAIDLVNNDYRNLEALKSEARQGAEMGYQGKQVIHPNQVTLVQDAFSPTPAEVAWAHETIGLYRQQQEQGNGAIGVNGKLIDMPVYRQAENILARARAAGLE